MLQPLGRKIVVELFNQEEMQDGIVIPDNAQDKSPVAKVIKLGTDPSGDLAIGDLVLLPKYGGIKIQGNKRDCQVFDEDSILGIATY